MRWDGARAYDYLLAPVSGKKYEALCVHINYGKGRLSRYVGKSADNRHVWVEESIPVGLTFEEAKRYAEMLWRLS